jgi:uncharacterized protein YqeY
MTALKDQISEQIKSAMKAKDKIRLNALRYVKKLLIENETSKKPIDEVDVVISHAKKLKDSLSMYPEDSQQRLDLQQELKVLEEFLPQQLSKDEVQALINDIQKNLDTPNMGQVMKELQPKIKGRFDGKLASQMVKDALAK